MEPCLERRDRRAVVNKEKATARDRKLPRRFRHYRLAITASTLAMTASALAINSRDSAIAFSVAALVSAKSATRDA
jgi:hypothetical protein